MRAAPWHQALADRWQWIVPDDRPNPLDADYILAPATYDLRSMLAEGVSQWRVREGFVRTEGREAEAALLERTAPAAEQLGQPMTKDRFERALGDTVDVPKIEGEGRFAADRLELTTEQFAYF
ncbi:MAG: hypothetical protein M5R36_09225 [Deltaproteobacteria bacterium]|nr:hypothetical protein [Deltaproteobacteria bacterium]